MKNLNTPEISVIVPVYNVEKYLKQALDSIIAQTFTDWECILVDDGSTDNSGEICEEYGRLDPRFIVVHKENSGLSGARNRGIQEARGKFIGFVDSDDHVPADYLEILHDLILRNDADVAIGNILREYIGFTRATNFAEVETVIEGCDVMLEYQKQRKMSGHACNKLFRREVITTPFPIGIVIEDLYTLTDWLQNARKVVITPAIVYNYRMRKGSLLNSRFVKQNLDFINNSMRLATITHNLYPDKFTAEQRDAAYLWKAVSGAKAIARKERNKEAREEAIEEISQIIKDIEIPSKKFLKGRTRRRAKLLKENPHKFISKMRFDGFFNFHNKYRESRHYD